MFATVVRVFQTFKPWLFRQRKGCRLLPDSYRLMGSDVA